MRGKTWWENCLCAGAKNMPLFSTLFLSWPRTGYLVEEDKQISPLRRLQTLRGSGRNEYSGEGEKATADLFRGWQQ
jgi:hypothetical protein